MAAGGAMKIAFEASDEAGRRAILLLIGDPEVEHIGLIGEPHKPPRDPRISNAESAHGFDLVVTDARDPSDAARTAREAETHLVTLADFDPDDALSDITQLSGSSLGSGIAPCLAWHEVAQTSEVLELSIAWTEPGKPLRRGEGVPFPDPVGARWGLEVGAHAINGIPSRQIAVPVNGDWAAAMARVTGVIEDGVVQRVVGVSDLAAHLEALALASGALTVGRGQFDAGNRTATDAAEPYLATALDMGMAVASYTSEVERSPRR